MSAIAVGTGATLTGIASALKTVYLPMFIDQVPHNIDFIRYAGGRDAITEPVLDGPEVGSLISGFMQAKGLTWVMGLRTTGAHSVGARAEPTAANSSGGVPFGLPPGNHQTYAQSQASPKYLYLRMQISHVATVVAQKGVGSYVDSLDAEMNGGLGDFMRLNETYLCGSGWGILAEITDLTGSGSGNSYAAGDSIPVDSVQYLEEGMAINLKAYSTGATDYEDTTTGGQATWGEYVGGGGVASYTFSPNDDAPTLIRITGVNRANSTITLDTAIDIDSDTTNFTPDVDSTYTVFIFNFGDAYVYSADSTHGALVFNGPMGLDGWIDDGTTTPSFQNIDRTVAGYSYWKALQLSASGGLDEVNHVQRMQDDIVQASKKKAPQIDILMSYTTRRVAQRTVAGFTSSSGPQAATNQVRRFDGNKAMTPTVALPTFNESPIVLGQKYKDGNMYFVDRSLFEIRQLEDPNWFDADGAVLSRRQNQAAMDAWLYWYYQFVAGRCNCVGKITDVA